MAYNFIDLFAGAGGLSEGFVRAGFEPIAHVEIDNAACNTLRTRAAYYHLKATNQYSDYVKYLMGEITRDDLYAKLPKHILSSIINKPIGVEHNDQIQDKIDQLLNGKIVDLIIGGPPCQAYSLVGRSRSKTKMEGDSRNYLFEQYAIYLEKYKPRMFVFENVLGLKSAKKGFYLKEMENRFAEKGYVIKLFVLEAKNFGVLQNRKRIIILGWLKNQYIEVPRLDEIVCKHHYRVNDLLSDLPIIKAGEGKNKFLHYQTESTPT